MPSKSLHVAVYCETSDNAACNAAWAAVLGASASYMVARVIDSVTYGYSGHLLDDEELIVLKNALVGIESARYFVCENEESFSRRMLDTNAAGGIPHKGAEDFSFRNCDEAFIDTPLTSSRAVVYVSPSGTSAGDGSLENPVDANTALQRYPVAATEEIRFLAGIHSVNLPVSFQQGGILITSDSGLMDVVLHFETGANLDIYGADIIIEHLEIFGRHPVREIDLPDRPPEIADAIPNFAIFGDNFTLRHCYVHDMKTIGHWDAASGGLIEECLLGMMGWQGSDRGHGHLWYSQHVDAENPRIFRRTILMPSLGNGIRCFVSNPDATIRNYLIEDTTNIEHEILTGGIGDIDDVTVDNNWTINEGMNFGYEPEASNGTLLATNNRMVSLNYPMRINFHGWNDLTFTDNYIACYDYTAEVDTPHYLLVARGTPSVVDFDFNSFFVEQDTGDDGLNLRYEWGTGLGTYAQFNANAFGEAGINANSTYTPNLPTGLITEIIPCEHGWLAEIRILNFDEDDFVSVDLSALALSNGASYRLRSAYDYHEDTMEFVYSAASPSVSLDMRPVNRSSAIPYGTDVPLAEIHQWFGCWILEEV